MELKFFKYWGTAWPVKGPLLLPSQVLASLTSAHSSLLDRYAKASGSKALRKGPKGAQMMQVLLANAIANHSIDKPHFSEFGSGILNHYMVVTVLLASYVASGPLEPLRYQGLGVTAISAPKK